MLALVVSDIFKKNHFANAAEATDIDDSIMRIRLIMSSEVILWYKASRQPPSRRLTAQRLNDHFAADIVRLNGSSPLPNVLTSSQSSMFFGFYTLCGTRHPRSLCRFGDSVANPPFSESCFYVEL